MGVAESEASAPQRIDGRGIPEVVYIMGTARSGSTLIGTLIGQAPGVFYSGELSDWPGRDGVSTVPRSIPFWEKVRASVGPAPGDAGRLKLVMEHPRGLAMPRQRHLLANTYRKVTLDVLEAVARHSSSTTVVDSSHYPRRAAALRRMIGPGTMRLVLMVRRPSAVARSFRTTDPKGELVIQLYLFTVGILAWLVYLTHPRRHRALISYEALVGDPLLIGAKALGRPLDGVDPGHLTVPLVFIGNRFVKDADHIAIRKPPPHQATLLDRVTDLLQWPLRLACFIADRASPGGLSS